MPEVTIPDHCLTKSKKVLCEEILRLRKISHLEDVIEHLYDGVYITDGEANTLRVNRAYEEICGTSRDKFIGKNMRQVVQEGLIDDSGTLKVVSSKQSITMQQTLSNGTVALINSTPIFDEDGQIRLIVTVVRDITQLTTLQKEVASQQKAIETYSSQISSLKELIDSRKDIICEDKNSRLLMEKAQQAALYDATVLLTGETGSGKEVIAQFIHKCSPRKNQAFVQINCTAIPDTLIESELFGYEKGSFTGASKQGKKGIFELAHKGTLFLDEIGELPLFIQPKILRAIQEKIFRRIGGQKDIAVDVRIIAATNRDLKKMVEDESFRDDLYYRLNVVPIHLPPLRERREDILPLVHHVLQQLRYKYNDTHKSFDKEALTLLYSYDWPGNIRELHNLVERLFIMISSSMICADDLPPALHQNKSPYLSVQEIRPLKEVMAEAEAILLQKTFQKTGSAKEAALLLGIDASTFVRKRQRYAQMGLYPFEEFSPSSSGE